MEIEYGAEVIDKSGKILGTVDHLVRNTWTGEISKFMVRRKTPESDLFFSTEDVLEATKSKVKVNISSDELNENA
jgi:sporulation protein YlmC with PRC-barrel domain